MNTGFRTLSIPFRSIHRLIQSVLPQLRFSFYRHQLLCADFSGGQITSDAGLLPLRSFDQRHRLTSDWAARLSDPRQDDRVLHDSLALLRQRIYQIVAGYEDANDAGRLRHDPLLQIVADQKLGHTLGSQPTLSRWENSPSGRDLVRLNDTWREQFIHLCGDEVRERGEILLDLDSTDDPTHGQQQLSFFNGAYGQHMYHPMPAGGTPASGKRLQSCPHRAHAVAPGTAFAVRFSRREDQTARRRRLRFPTALPVLRVLRHPIRHRHPRQLRLPTARPIATEAVKAALSLYASAAAQLFQFPPSRPQLVPSAPHLLQGGTLRRRNQLALRGD